MGGIGEELPLARGAGIDPFEQVVQRVAQPGQLVVAILDRETTTRLRGRR